ncbi:MAG: hypothetical protein HUU55_15490 [Myxococcales bacterium]|nr:hypothetical protein [Myxococcales bacterium]
MVRRGCLALFGIVLVLGVQSLPVYASCVTPPADISQNGITDVVDVQCGILTALYTLGGSVGELPACIGPDTNAADVNCDGQADVVDVQLIIGVALKSPFSLELDLDQDGCVDTCEGLLFCADKTNGAPCSDGEICTVADVCFEGSCLPGAPNPCDDGNSCTSDVCVLGSGCTHTPTGDPVASNCCSTHSGGGCTVASCSACVCDQNPLCCLPLIGTWNAQCVQLAFSATCAGQCKCTGASCDDANVCTSNTTCGSGVCGGGTPLTCNDSNGCTNDTCDPQQGCVFAPADGKSCDQGTGCTAQGVCTDGVCVVPGKNCDDGNPCTQDSCPLTANDCVFVVDVSICDDDNSCTQDSCSPQAGCVHMPIGDAAPSNCCTPHSQPQCANDVCESCVCAAMPICCAPFIGSWSAQCAEMALSAQCVGQCKCTAAPCDDGDACTTGSSCANGMCEGGTAAQCDDGNVCTADSCDPVKGCVHEAETGETCDPNAPCVPVGICSAGQCLPGPINCDDGIACTTDSCPPTGGGCLHVPNNAACNDNNVCTTDTCATGGCANTPTGDKVPSDCCSAHSSAGCSYNQCQSCVCAINPACCAPFIGSWTQQCAQIAASGQCANTCACGSTFGACDDGNVCTTGTACAQGQCSGGTPVVCNDNNPCTTDSCNPLTGCVYTSLTGAACSDGLPCTVGDVCTAGVCIPGPNQCDDDKPCTDDTCTAAGACIHTPVSSLCNDNNVCTIDTCSSSTGNCTYTPTGFAVQSNCCAPKSSAGCSNTTCQTCVCQAQPQCCAPFIGAWTASCAQMATTGSCASQCQCTATACDDQNACTSGMTCSSTGQCVGGSAVNCNDNNPCTLDTCDPTQGCVHTPATGTACTDGKACTLGDTCSSMGVCVPGPNACADGIPCTDDTCTTSGCVFSPNAAKCDDNNVCTADSCTLSAGCVHAPTGDAVPSNCCSAHSSTAGCTFGACQTCVCNQMPQCCLSPVFGGGWTAQCAAVATTGACTATCQCTAKSCNDGDQCTTGDICVAGSCDGQNGLNCADNNPCTVDVCDDVLGCQHLLEPAASSCCGKCGGAADTCACDAQCVAVGDCCDDYCALCGGCP